MGLGDFLKKVRSEIFDILLVMVAIVFCVGLGISAYYNARLGISIITSASTLLMAIFVAYQARELEKQAELTNQYIFETQKQRLNLEEIKDLLHDYLNRIEGMSKGNEQSDWGDTSKYKYFPKASNHVREMIKSLPLNDYIKRGFLIRVGKYLDDFLDSQGLYDLIDQHNKIVSKKPIDEKKLEENLKKILYVVNRIKSMPEEELDKMLMSIIATRRIL